MIIVLPVCQKDADAALRNLEWVRQLDGCTPFTCVVHHDSGFDAAAVIASAKLTFAQVTESVYQPPPPKPWPGPQNAAWQAAALHVFLKIKQPWFWWEQDCVPLARGSFTTLAGAYEEAGSPFMGALTSAGNVPHINGVAVYPPSVPQSHPEMMMATRGPFDVVGGASVLKHAKITPFLQHVWELNALPPTFPTHDSLSIIEPEAVFFHRCKDDTLLAHLRKAIKLTSKERLRAKPVSDVTVVITNFQRPEMLWAAYASCKAAQVAHIVVTSSGTTPAVETVLERILKDPSAKVSARRDDAGCNENWIRGAGLVRTSKMTILHDDDLLTPEYEAVVAGRFKADVIHWDGAKHTPQGPFPGTYVTNGTLPQGVWPITYLLPFLLNPQAHTLSPVCGCFPTNHVLATLNEAEKKFGDWAYLRPTMMVGNDLLLWLRACQKFRTVYYSHVPFCSYGHHGGSASYQDAVGKELKLLPIYKATRAYFVSGMPRMIHCINRFIPKDIPMLHRIHGAAISWDIGYHYEFIKPCHQWAWHRDATSIGEPTPTPFLRDVLERGMAECTSPDDVVCMTNDDTIVNQYFWFSAMDWLRDKGAGCSFRRNVTPQQMVDCWAYPDKPMGVQHCGRDAFFFTQDWLKAHLKEMPDYIMGFCDWDSTLGMLIRLSNGNKPQAKEFSQENAASELPSRFIYHTDHLSQWSTNFDFRGNQHSRALTNDFFRRNLGWEMPKLRNGQW